MFFFGFLSSILPYAATIVVMALYFLIGTPKEQVESTTFHSHSVSIKQNDSKTRSQYASFEISVSFFKSEINSKTAHPFVFKEKLKPYSPYIKHYTSCISSALSNKAPPVLA